MDPQLTELFREMEDACRQQGGIPRVTREAGQFLNILAKATRARHLLQVGADDGYLALWLAEAVADRGGEVTVVEADVWRYDAIREIVERSPVRDAIRLLQGEFSEMLPVIEGPYDFVLLTVETDDALHVLQMLFEKISSGALICCEKAMSRSGRLAEYLAYVHERPGLESVLAPIGEGIEITYKVP